MADEAILDSHYTQVLLGNKDTLFMTLPHEEIREIHKRWYQLRDDALEIFMLNGKTALFSFADTRVNMFVMLSAIGILNAHIILFVVLL